jgi:hypothetical protein
MEGNARYSGYIQSRKLACLLRIYIKFKKNVSIKTNFILFRLYFSRILDIDKANFYFFLLFMRFICCMTTHYATPINVGI